MDPGSKEYGQGLAAANVKRERNVTPNGTKQTDFLVSPDKKFDFSKKNSGQGGSNLRKTEAPRNLKNPNATYDEVGAFLAQRKRKGTYD